MNYSAIKFNDIANGTGVRTTLFVSGCRNHCEGCFQPETWDFHYGKSFTIETENEIIESMTEYIEGLTLLGGDPFEPENQRGLINFLWRFKKSCPSKTIWVYTGYLLDDLLDGGRKHIDVTDWMLSCVDVLVDGRFILSQKNITLKFRGSENQRLIDMNEYRRTGEVREVIT